MRKSEDGGETAALRSIQGERTVTKTIHNRWLLRQLSCHVNVEICSSVKNFKYVLKYYLRAQIKLLLRFKETVRAMRSRAL